MKRILVLLILLAIACSTGCTRTFWRRQADADAYNLLREKAIHPHWAIPNYTIALDPRSRMFDPYCADCPPLPPDDPTAHQFMHCVDDKRGWPFWHNNGDVPNVENPAWAAYFEYDPDGMLVLRADDAVRIGLLNSRNYQQEKEELYLSALDVSFERFRFDTQGFAGYQTFFTADGQLRTGSGNSSSDFLASTFSLGARPAGWSLQKLFSTGSTLVVGFANSLVWQFSGPDDYAGATLIDFSLVQPLLKNAGRERVLERLTRSERVLLYNVRLMEQYQQGFYLQVMTGRDAGNGPSRQGGVFGGAGLEGFTGIGGGGFGRLTGGGNVNTGGGGAGGAGAGGAGGYMGLLQNQQVIRNQQDNVERLRLTYEKLLTVREIQPNPATGPYLEQKLQVEQSRQALFNAESTLLNLNNQYQQTLDAFKITLGLPPQLGTIVQDDMLRDFQLIDPLPVQLQTAVDRIATQYGQIERRVRDHIVNPDEVNKLPGRLVWYAELPDDLTLLIERAEKLRPIRQQLLDYMPKELETDFQRFDAALPRRKASLTRLQQRVQAQRGEPFPLLPIRDLNNDIFQLDRLDQSHAAAQTELVRLSGKIDVQYKAHLDQQIQKLQAILEGGPGLAEEQRYAELQAAGMAPIANVAAAPGGIRELLKEVEEDLLDLQLLQARMRSESIELPPVDIRAEQALEVARKYRRDWMNARAGLVDSWRLIEFNADQLKGSLSILFSGDLSNASDNPFSLNSDTGRLRVGAQFDAPITRLSERNVYRQSLIEYQQARRSYYAFEDAIAATLRANLRTLYTNTINFELQRQAVLIAAEQSFLNFQLQNIRDQEQLRPSADRTVTNVTAARDAVSALSDLLNAQNNFLSIWVNYEALRRALDFDLGTMQLDTEGLWVDPGTIGEDYGQFDPWLWKTDGYDPGLPQPHEVAPAELIPIPRRANVEQLPLTKPTPAELAPPQALPLPPTSSEQR